VKFSYDGPVPVPSAHFWRSNAQLMAAAAYLGYITEPVLDCTYGLGVFWRDFKELDLVGTDIDPERSPYGQAVDFTELHRHFLPGQFSTVVFDPPYKLHGTPATPGLDHRYGLTSYRPIASFYGSFGEGLTQACLVSRDYVLVKAQDQVVSGQKSWQTYYCTRMAEEELGMSLVDRFEYLRAPRPQPGNRRWQHTHTNYSTLLVFRH
jgi:hypothetical protein